ncbi:MAG: hypothetical protein AAF004_14840 [Pseudomonadota bacterium]
MQTVNHQQRDIANEFAQMITAILFHVEEGDLPSAAKMMADRDHKLRLMGGAFERDTLIEILEQDRQLADALQQARNESAQALREFRRSRTASAAYAQNQSVSF